MTNPEESRRLLREALEQFDADLPDLQMDPAALQSWFAAHPEFAELWLETVEETGWAALADVIPPGSVTSDEVARFERQRQIAVESAGATPMIGAWFLPGGTVLGAGRALARVDRSTAARALEVSDLELTALETGRKPWFSLKRLHVERFAVMVEVSLKALVRLLRMASQVEIAARSPRLAGSTGGGMFRDAGDVASEPFDADAVRAELVAAYRPFFQQFADLEGPAETQPRRDC